MQARTLTAAELAGFTVYHPTPLGVWLGGAVLRKAIVRTPTNKEGRVDYDSVPVGASIWVSVSDPSSPLHGRPILITKRPDHKFALTGGAGWDKWKDDVPADKKAGSDGVAAGRARKHMVLEGVGNRDNPKRQADKEALAEKRREVKAAQDEQRKKREGAARELLSAAGYDPDKLDDDSSYDELRDRVREQARDAGLNAKQTQQLVKLTAGEAKKIRKRLALQRAELEALAHAAAADDGRDGIAEEHQALLDSLPDPDSILDQELISPEQLQELAASGASDLELEQAVKESAEQLVEELHQQAAEQPPAEPEPAAPEPEQPAAEEPAAPEPEPEPAAPEPEAPAAEPEPAAPEPEQPAAEAPAAEPEPAAPEPEQPAAEEPAAPEPEPAGETDAERAEREAKEAEALEAAERAKREAKEAADRERREKLRSAYGAYYDANRGVRDTRAAAKAAHGRLVADGAEVENLRQNVEGLSREAVDRLLARYHEPHRLNPPDAFYSALRDHWNDAISYADGIGSYAKVGATSAISGLLGKLTGEGIDVGKLIEGSSIEAACTALAFRLKEDLPPEQLDDLIDKLTRHNATNQERTETRALASHKRLERERQEIIRQRLTGELQGGDDAPLLDRLASGQLSPAAVARHATSVRLEADNLLRQRENLGVALGSMQASATLLEALTRAKRVQRKKDHNVVINFGDLAATQDHLREMGLNGRARIKREAGQYRATIPARALRRRMGKVQTATQFADEMQQVKSDGSSTEGYEVPFWRDTFKDASGAERKHAWRTEQRNDIEWLKRTGGGVITRVTGAGKTNTTLGYFAHQLAARPDYTGAIVVPKGKASEWHEEAQRFSTLPTVHIPDDAKRGEVARIIKDAGRGALLVMSHDQASRHADLLEGANLDGLALDEPQMLIGSGKSKRMSTGAQRIMKIGSAKLKTGDTFNRIALTATPAKDDPVNAYDLVNWVAPGRVGARTRFRSAYAGGFGAGTNAQEEAIHEQVLKHLGPYMSGERLTPPSFKTHRYDTSVRRSATQIERQREIERGAKAQIEARVAKRLLTAQNDPLLLQKYGRTWRAKIAAEETAKAQAEIATQHRENLGGGDDNPKIAEAIKAVQAAGADASTKHVFFVDSAAQRQALVAALRGAGYKTGQIANMAASTTSISGDELAARRQKFKTDADTPFVIIDKVTAAGHNLQEGSHLHVLGTPGDAATYLQAQGRIAREPRKGDVHIHGYRYEDSPFEAADWGDLERQLKILRATAPGLTSGG